MNNNYNIGFLSKPSVLFSIQLPEDEKEMESKWMSVHFFL